MSEMWWLQPGWTETLCAQCGARIWPDGDPDWGVCLSCMTAQQSPSPPCDICSSYPAVTNVSGMAVCSQACAHEAENLKRRLMHLPKEETDDE